MEGLPPYGSTPYHITRVAAADSMEGGNRAGFSSKRSLDCGSRCDTDNAAEVEAAGKPTIPICRVAMSSFFRCPGGMVTAVWLAMASRSLSVRHDNRSQSEYYRKTIFWKWHMVKWLCRGINRQAAFNTCQETRLKVRGVKRPASALDSPLKPAFSNASAYCGIPIS